MEKMLYDAFDKIRAGDELKRKTLDYIYGKRKEIGKQRYAAMCIGVLMIIAYFIFSFLLLV